MSGTADDVTIDGLSIAVETAAEGDTSLTSGQSGYINGSKGADGDPIDVMIGPGGHTYVIDQRSPETGDFDEHKVMLRYPSREAAVADYVGSFSDGRGADRIEGVTQVSGPELNAWLEHGNTRQPITGQVRTTPSSAHTSRRGSVRQALQVVVIFAAIGAYIAITSLIGRLDGYDLPTGCWSDPYNGVECDPTCEDLRDAGIYPAETSCKS